MLHIQCHMAALDFSHVQGHGLRCHVPDLIVLFHATWQAAMLDMAYHVEPGRVMCFIQVVLYYFNYNSPLLSKLIP